MIKRILIAVLFAPLLALAQSYPSPTVQNLTVLGTLTAPAPTFTSPLPVASGGTGSATASGTALDNISGFSGTGYVKRTGAGAYSFVLPIPVTDGGTGASSASGTALDNITGFNSTGFMSRAGAGSYTFSSRINLTNLANQAANTVVANVTSSSTTPTAFAMPSCSTSSSAVNYTTNTGFGCNSAINAAQLGGATFAAPGPIGSTTPSTGAFTTLSASSTVSGAGFTSLLAPYAPLASPALTGSPTAPTQAVGTNNTTLATTAFVSNRGPCANIMDFGGNNAGSANNDTAFSNALSAASNGGTKCVYFPPGQFNFSAQVGYSFVSANQSVTIQGAGQDVTQLYWPANGGLGFSYLTCDDTVHIQDLTIMAGTTNAGSGITLGNPTATTIQSCALNTIQRVTIRSSTGYFGANYFVNAILVQGVSGINFDSLQLIGTSAGTVGVGILIGTNGHSIVPIVYNISNSSINNFQYGLEYGTLVQGVQVTNSNFTNDAICIYVPAGETGLDQLSVSNSQFNALAGNPNISIGSAIPNALFSNNLFLINNNSSGINMGTTSTTTITGNSFEPNTGSPTNVYGIVISGWTNAGGVITGNSFFNLTGGIALQASSKNFNVQSNVYQSNTSNTINAGTGNVIGGGSP